MKKQRKLGFLALIGLVAVASLFTVCKVTGAGGDLFTTIFDHTIEVGYGEFRALQPTEQKLLGLDPKKLAGPVTIGGIALSDGNNIFGIKIGKFDAEKYAVKVYDPNRDGDNNPDTPAAGTPQWPAGGIFVTFDAGEGVLDGSATAEVAPGGTVGSLPSASRGGYTFGLWWTEPGGGGSRFDGETVVNAGITVYAKWLSLDASQRALTFGLSGGSLSGSIPGDNPQIVGTGAAAVRPVPDPHNTGHTFDGWFDAESGGSEIAWPLTITESRTVYARWTAKTSALSFDMTGGDGAPAGVITAAYGAAMPPIGAVGAALAGYDFTGYYDAASGGVRYYTADGASARDWDKETSPETLYAQWALTPVYSITLSNGDDALDDTTYGFSAATQPLTYTVPAALSVTVENTGNAPTGALTASADSSNFTITPTGGAITSIAASDTGVFTVQPTTGLDSGTYTATVTVSGGNISSKSFNVSFTVEGIWLGGDWSADWSGWLEDSVVADPSDPTAGLVDPGDPGAIYTAPGDWIVIKDEDITTATILTITVSGDTFGITGSATSAKNVADQALGTTGVKFESVSGNRRVVVTGGNAASPLRLMLDGVAISATNSPIDLQSDANVIIVLAGTNTLTATAAGAGVRVPDGCTATITSVSAGTLTAQGFAWSAGIGGSQREIGGTISIGGNAEVTAAAAPAGSEGGAGIGGGGTKGGGTTTIGGNAKVMATVGAASTAAAAIGGGHGGAGGTITIGGNAQVLATGGSVASNTTSGAGIGGGAGGAGGTITIGGGIVIARTNAAKSAAAAIGAGNGARSGTITIIGGFVLAQSANPAAPDIGSNSYSAWAADTNEVTITGGSVHAAKTLVSPAPREAGGVTPVFPLYAPGTLAGNKTIIVTSPVYTAKTMPKAAARFLATGLFTPSGTGQFPAVAVDVSTLTDLFPAALSATLWLPTASYTGITVGGVGTFSANVQPAIVPYTDGGANRLLQ